MALVEECSSGMIVCTISFSLGCQGTDDCLFFPYPSTHVILIHQDGRDTTRPLVASKEPYKNIGMTDCPITHHPSPITHHLHHFNHAESVVYPVCHPSHFLTFSLSHFLHHTITHHFLFSLLSFQGQKKVTKKPSAIDNPLSPLSHRPTSLGPGSFRFAPIAGCHRALLRFFFVENGVCILNGVGGGVFLRDDRMHDFILIRLSRD